MFCPVVFLVVLPDYVPHVRIAGLTLHASCFRSYMLHCVTGASAIKLQNTDQINLGLNVRLLKDSEQQNHFFSVTMVMVLVKRECVSVSAVG